jgi:hypothetical protein
VQDLRDEAVARAKNSRQWYMYHVRKPLSGEANFALPRYLLVNEERHERIDDVVLAALRRFRDKWMANEWQEWLTTITHSMSSRRAARGGLFWSRMPIGRSSKDREAI